MIKIIKKINFLVVLILLISILILSYILNKREEGILSRDCINRAEVRLNAQKEKEGDGLIIDATYNYSKNEKICYYIESQRYVSSSGVLDTKYIYNLYTNEKLYYYVADGDGNVSGGQSKFFVDNLEYNILKNK